MSSADWYAESPARRLQHLVAGHPIGSLIAEAFLAWLVAAWVPSPAVSLVGTLLLVFWLPGVALLRLLRPRPWSMTANTVCFSTALSVSVAIAVGILLALTTDRVPRVPAATILCGLTIVAALLTGRRTGDTGRSDGHAEQPSSWPVGWIAGTVAGCCLLTGLLTYLTWRLYETPAPGGSYTALSVSHHGNQTDIVVDNRQTSAMTFRLTISHGRHTIVTRAFSLPAGAEYQLEIKTSALDAGRGRSTARLVIEPSGKVDRSLVF
jgi:hypothetical protein